MRSKLGNTLLKLKYTGDFIQRRYFIPTTELFPGPDSFQYLTVGLYEANNKNINWHIGFLVDSTDTTYNKFFLMTNLLTEAQRSIRIDLTKPVAGFNNYRFRNVESQYNFDTTYQNTFTTTLNFPAGEGYLYQVAPVVKYGGKLAFNDTIKSNTTLFDDMTIHRFNNNNFRQTRTKSDLRRLFCESSLSTFRKCSFKFINSIEHNQV